MGERLTEIFMLLFCEKNSDGTKNLVLKGTDMWQRIGVRLVASDMIKVAQFLSDHPEVISLNLCYNDIKDNGVNILVLNYLQHEENTLEHLNLMNCSISHVGLHTLLFNSQNLKLKTLRLNGNKIGFKGGKHVAHLLGKSTTLEHLDVGDCDQTLSSLMYFMTAIREDIGTNKTLRVLDLSRIIPTCDMYQYEPGHLAENLGIMLSVNTQLLELHVQKCEMDGHDIELMLDGLSRNFTLLCLDIGYNQIGDFGIELLAKWLKTRPNLLGLNIAGNSISDIGARALSFCMPFSKLRMLDISSNKMTDAGIIDILNSIKKPYMMRVFYIWGNKFGEPTNRVIERMLLSGVLDQEHIDVRMYEVDNHLYAALYRMDRYKHKYYCVMDYGCPVMLKIRRNDIEEDGAQPRALLQFKFHGRIPDVDPNITPKESPC